VSLYHKTIYYIHAINKNEAVYTFNFYISCYIIYNLYRTYSSI